jgi:4-oxalomesaconate tautomerase
VSVEHPSGEFTVNLTVGGTPENPVVERAGLLRTARKLFEGKTFAHESARTAAPRQAAE